MSDFPPPPSPDAPPPAELPPPAPAAGATSAIAAAATPRAAKRWLPVMVVAALVAVAVAVVLTRGGEETASAGEILTEPANEVGPTPFTPPVITTNPAAGTTSTSSSTTSTTTTIAATTSTVTPTTVAGSTTSFDPASTSSSPSTSSPSSTIPGASSTSTPLVTLPLGSVSPFTTVPGGGGGGAGSGGPVIPTVTGNQPGLYGGTRNDKVCDAELLVSFLEANPDKAAAWAGAQGIQVGQIRTFVATLTPVLLRNDTRVTNYGFKDGKATSRQAVLQAGTGVFVDQFGVPRARCLCGNPLGPPKQVTGTPTYTGPQWPGFDPANTQTVTPAPAPIDTLVLTDPATGDTIIRDPGGDVEPSTTVAPATTVGATTTSFVDTTTTAAPTTTAATVADTTTTTAVATTTTAAPTTTVAPPTSTTTAGTTVVTTTPPGTATADFPPTPAGLTNIAPAGAFIASSEYPGGQFPTGHAFDGDPTTSWFSAGDADSGCAEAYGAPCSGIVWGNADNPAAFIGAIRILGNGQNADPAVRRGYGFQSVRITIANWTTPDSSETTFEQTFTLDGDEGGVLALPNAIGNFVTIVFFGHDSPDCGGVSEIEILG